MSENLSYAVLGAGNGGMAVAAEIASKGFRVSLWEGIATTKFQQLCETRHITLSGTITAEADIAVVTEDIKTAVDGFDVLLLVVPAFAHEPIFERLIPHLRDGHDLVIIPGNFGGFVLRRMMKEQGCSAKITISETASLPYACRATAFDQVMIHKHKVALKLGTWPVAESDRILAAMRAYSPIYQPATNVLEVSFDNINSVLHPLPVLLSYGAIDLSPEKFRHYIDGVTPKVSEQMAAMDEERMKFGEKFGLNLEPTLTQLKKYYGDNDAQTFYEFVNSDESPYKEVWGHSTHSRYLTEDAPCTLTPMMLLGEKAGLTSKRFQMSIALASMLHDVDYVAKGTNLEKLGLQDATLEEIKQMAIE